MAIITNLQYHYLTKNKEEKQKFLQEVQEQAGIAKSTFYKYIKGEIDPPKLIKEKLQELTGINSKNLNDEYYRTVQSAI